MLDIEYMHIEYCEACSCDYLEIVFGLSSDGVTFGRKCGYMRSFSYFSFRESLKVLFVSDVKSRYRGFRATYTQVNHTGKLFGMLLAVEVLTTHIDYCMC